MKKIDVNFNASKEQNIEDDEKEETIRKTK